ncbi:MAG TPA: hypothetical protein VMS74_08380 [Acidimicrobiia bacterium]|nr:hypothetical protein [Acidimicrobiia bacterium]
MRMTFSTAVLAVLIGGCGSAPMSPANIASEPGGVLAVSFTRTFPAGFWELGAHAYRLVIVCPTQRVGPPVVRFEVSEDAARFGEVYLRFDGPGTSLLSPADLAAIHPADTTVAVVTLAGMTESDAEEARSECEATVVYDGREPDQLEPGTPFSP